MGVTRGCKEAGGGGEEVESTVRVEENSHDSLGERRPSGNIVSGKVVNTTHEGKSGAISACQKVLLP